MSSIVHKYNILLLFMILLILSVKAQFTGARGFYIPILSLCALHLSFARALLCLLLFTNTIKF